MESSMAQDVHSVTAVVQQYLHDVESSPTGVEERSHLAQLCSEAILLFQIILKTLPANGDSVSKKGRTMEISLKRSYERMKMWSDENGVVDGGLDATLAASRDLQRDTLKYIVSISQTLTERLVKFLDINLDETGLESIYAIRSLTAAVTEGDSDDSSESEFSDSSASSVKGVLEDLRVDTTCLLDLEPLLSSPILRTDPEPTAILDTTRIRWSPYQPYSDKVSVRFPMAADDLVSRLGKANYERYLRCQEQKATNELGDIPSDQTASAVPDSASSKFHDSGIGSSLPTTASAYAETVMSYGMGEGRRIRVPPLPARAKEGLPFECVACGKWVKITANSAWKQHIYRDLEPWICLEADCFVADDTFPTRNDWISHLALDHGMDPEWRMRECPLCRIEIGPGKLPITRHMSDHLEEISLSALPADCEFEEESEGGEPDQEDDYDNLGIKPKTWLNLLAIFHQTKGREVGSVLALSKKSLSLFDLNLAVEGLGGYEQVTESKGWYQVCRELGFGVDEVAETAGILQNAYNEWILPYEESLGHIQERLREPSNAPSLGSVGADPIISTVAEEAISGTQSLELMKGVANSQDSRDGMPQLAVPSINIDYAPPPVRSFDGRPSMEPDALTPTAGGYQHTKWPSPDWDDSSRYLSPLDRPQHTSPNRQRQFTSTIPNNVIALRLVEGEGSQDTSGGPKRVQKHPATFQCSLCPKRFTRAYNLRSHLRTHTDERPFVCTVCGKAFARQHDRKRHEGLHSGPPLQESPSAAGQTEVSQGQPGKPQFGHGLNPPFDHPGGSGPIPRNPNNPQDTAIRAMLAQLDPEQRQKFRQLPPDKINELFAKWKRQGMLRPGSPQQEMPMNPAPAVYPTDIAMHPVWDMHIESFRKFSPDLTPQPADLGARPAGRHGSSASSGSASVPAEFLGIGSGHDASDAALTPAGSGNIDENLGI